jgi:uncharacterized protein (TIGR02271 family)
MTTQTEGTVVGVFHDHEQARRAIRALKDAGFNDDQIGVASSNTGGRFAKVNEEDKGSYAGEGAATGVAAGAGLGALWGLGILAGVLPAIGPAIAGGTLAAILASAAVGAAAAGLAGALIGMGIPKEEAEYYESEMKAGRTIVTVHAGSRREQAMAVLRQFSGYDFATRNTAGLARPAAAQGAHGQSVMGATSHTTAAAGQACDTGVRPAAQAAATGTVRAHEEKLNVQKTPVQTGEAVVRKEVHTEHKTIDVPVTREELVIERHAGSGQVSSADIKEGQEIRVPIREEQVNVEKQTVVAEEVTVGKRKVQDTERVDADLKKEEIKVEAKGDVNVREKKK